MSEISDQHYLLTDQYKNAANLNARIQLHRRFSTNKEGWHHWIFNHFNIAPGSRILELGCGPALLWRSNLDRIPPDWDITLSDFSPGMLEEAQQNIQNSKRPFAFEIIDAQSIPYPNESFDIVIANHMLYHVPDRAKALTEIRCVLKPHGRLYVSTIGRSHMRELKDLARRIVPTPLVSKETNHYPFTLESGTEELAHWFAQVTLYRYEDALVVTETEPLIAYALSGRTGRIVTEEQIQTFRTLVEQEIAEHGAIHITNASGLFEAIL